MDLQDLIIKLSEENHITAYEIAQNTSVSANTVRNVLKKSNIKTKQKNLLEIVEYLENAIVGTKAQYELNEEFQSKVAAEETKYTTNFKDLKIDDKLNIIFNILNQQKDAIKDISLGISSLLLDNETEKLQKEIKN